MTSIEEARRGGAALRSPDGGGNAAFGLILFLVIVVNFFDFYNGYPKNIIVLMAYFMITVLAILFLYRKNITSIQSLLPFVVLFALCYFSRYLLDFFKNSSIGTGLLLGIMLVFNPWLVYLFFIDTRESKALTIVRFLYYIAIIVICFIIIFTYVKIPAQQTANLKPGESLNKLGAWGSSQFKEIGKSFSNGVNILIKGAVGDLYPGEIEDNEDEKLGIFLENLKPISSKFYTDEDAIVEATLYGKTFKGIINVNNLCYIEGKKQGTMYPKTLEIATEESMPLECNLGKLSEGSYEVKFAATFTFETWAYITYTYMDKDDLRAARAQGKDVNEMYKINPEPIAVFTSGPVSVGMPSLSQPLGIDVKNPNSPMYPLGVSLENRWTNGRVEQGREFTLRVPHEIELRNCTRKITSTADEKYYTIYKFTMDSSNARSSYDSVRCWMYLKPNEVGKFLGADITVQKTFVATASYLYTVEASTSITVEK